MNCSVKSVWCGDAHTHSLMQMLTGAGLDGMKSIPVCSHHHAYHQGNLPPRPSVEIAMSSSQLSAMDVLVQTTMKGAAKCDKHRELQNSVNRQGLERILCFWDIPESMSASVSIPFCFSSCISASSKLLRVVVPQ